jgi:NAD(P)-dependent dehydrogenase (short-subunit alcohol dehydrogenase family)
MAGQPEGQNRGGDGGARGIGAATARTLDGAGVRVVIGDVDLSLAERTAHDIGPATALPLDVADRAAFTAFLDDALGLGGACVATLYGTPRDSSDRTP